MPHEMTTDFRRIDEQLQDLRNRTLALRDEIQRLAPSIKQVDVSDETAQAIERFSDAAAQLLGAEQALAGRIGLFTIVSGDLQLLVKDLANLREVNLRYRQAFDDLWRASVPVHITAILQAEKMTEAEAWKRRWGPASETVLALLATSTDNRAGWALRPSQEKALLTLRYANQSLSEVAKMLDVSPPLVLARQVDLETELVIKLFEAHIQAHTDKKAWYISAGDERFAGRRSTTAGLSDRLSRYARLLTVKHDSTEHRVILRVITSDEDQPALAAMQTIGHDILAVYFLGRHEFKFVRRDESADLTIERLERTGKASFQEVTGMTLQIL